MNRYSVAERAYLGAVSTVLRQTMLVPPSRDFHRTFATEVVGLAELSPGVRRLTLAGEGLASLVLTGPDEHCGLLMPPAGCELVLPPGAKLNPRSELGRMPEDVRPELRWYTIRRHRPDSAQVDLDVIKHASGPGEAFMRRVAVGDKVGFREGVASYRLLPGRHVVMGDETAAPAIAAIRESLPGEAPVDIYLEVPDDGYLGSFDSTAGINLLFRGDAAPGALLARHLSSSELPGYDFGWIAGEASMVKQLRRWLVARGTDRKHVAFSSYWILGRPRP